MSVLIHTPLCRCGWPVSRSHRVLERRRHCCDGPGTLGRTTHSHTTFEIQIKTLRGAVVGRHKRERREARPPHLRAAAAHADTTRPPAARRGLDLVRDRGINAYRRRQAPPATAATTTPRPTSGARCRVRAGARVWVGTRGAGTRSDRASSSTRSGRARTACRGRRRRRWWFSRARPRLASQITGNPSKKNPWRWL